MADYDSQLPIRSEADGTDERVLVKIQDGDNPGGANETATVSEKKVHVRIHAEDSDGNDLQPLLSQEGHVQSNGDYDASTNKRPSSQGLIVSDRDASPSETTMNKRVTAIAGEDDTVCIDIALRDHSGQRYDEQNPLAVFQADDPGIEISSFDQGVAIVKDADDDHEYTVSATKSFKRIKAFGSASGKARFELQVETAAAAGTFDTVMVKFNSTANPNVEFEYNKTVATGVIVKIVRTNLDNQPQDLYSQIEGIEV